MMDERFDMFDHGVREAMQEIRSVRDPVCNHQTGFTIEHSGGRDSTVDSQAGVNDLNPITSLGSSHDSQIMLQPAALHGTSSGVTGSRVQAYCPTALVVLLCIRVDVIASLTPKLVSTVSMLFHHLCPRTTPTSCHSLHPRTGSRDRCRIQACYPTAPVVLPTM